MLKELIWLSLFRPILIAGELTCPDPNWVLHESICIKAVVSNVANGTRKCQKENPESNMIMLKTSTETHLYSSLFRELRLWAGLEFYMGVVWKWKDDTEYDENGAVQWAIQPYNPSLCIGIGRSTGELYDQICSFHQGVICQKDVGNTGSCESGWVKDGFLCYKLFRKKLDGVIYTEALDMCKEDGAELIMPKSSLVAKWISTSFGCSCWIGLTDYNADGMYIWNDGTLENISNMWWYQGGSRFALQPDNREKNNLCAYVYRGELYDDDCSSLNNVICEVNATDQMSTIFDISSDTPSKSYIDTSTADVSRTSSLIPGGTSVSEKMSTLRKIHTNGASTADETTTVANLTKHRVTCTTPCDCLWNYTDPSDNKHDRQTYLPYKVNKKTLSSYRGRRQCARDYRKSALYLGCGGITVLVLFPLFIVMLDFLPSARKVRYRH
ncbi:unnamed protein product [Mytilus edulis]|uniref:C-type lectin domain-containing protein n=1 Tax=Mytilus edulis TaxID=6550 RepID=A0A8S3UY72_MYTED|nr:unnamed protein product [Mytilus edulis]